MQEPEQTLDEIHDIVWSRHDPAYFVHRFAQHAETFDPRVTAAIDVAGQGNDTLIVVDPDCGNDLIAALLLWEVLFSHDHTVLVATHRHFAACTMRDRVSRMYDGLPPYMRVDTRRNNARTIEFENGSRLFFGTIGPNLARGLSVSAVFLPDYELADLRGFPHFWQSNGPAMVRGARSVITTCNENALDDGMRAKFVTAVV